MESQDKRLIIHVTQYWNKQASKHAAILVALWDWQQLCLFFSITNLSSHDKEFMIARKTPKHLNY